MQENAFYFKDLDFQSPLVNAINNMIYQRWWLGEVSFEELTHLLDQQIYHADTGRIRLLFNQQHQMLGFFCFADFPITGYEQVALWLSYLYVVPEHRQQDLGRILLQEALIQAKALQIPQLFILTDKQTQYYQNLGCQAVDSTVFLSRKLNIMCANLRDTPSKPKLKARLVDI